MTSSRPRDERRKASLQAERLNLSGPSRIPLRQRALWPHPIFNSSKPPANMRLKPGTPCSSSTSPEERRVVVRKVSLPFFRDRFWTGRLAMPKILLTTTSFQDTPGEHHQLLANTGWEVIRARGPLNEADTLALVGDVDGYICGDDMITRRVLEKARPKLKVLSKYGIGVDKIDVKSCTEFGIPLLFTPGVNHTTVAEHTFLLLLALEKNFLFHTDSTRVGSWKRKTGHELFEKTIGIVGLGRIGQEVVIRARAFGMNAIGY